MTPEERAARVTDDGPVALYYAEAVLLRGAIAREIAAAVTAERQRCEAAARLISYAYDDQAAEAKARAGFEHASELGWAAKGAQDAADEISRGTPDGVLRLLDQARAEATAGRDAAVRAAVATERERCADVCDAAWDIDIPTRADLLELVADRIRNGGADGGR